ERRDSEESPAIIHVQRIKKVSSGNEVVDWDFAQAAEIASGGTDSCCENHRKGEIIGGFGVRQIRVEAGDRSKVF
ncbi:hypothetical protein U1Q18_034203, partial [Sarracenia purpurea var. burkii]